MIIEYNMCYMTTTIIINYVTSFNFVVMSFCYVYQLTLDEIHSSLFD